MSSYSYYGLGERIALPLAGGLIAPALSALVYRFVRRRLREQETLTSRAYLLYRALSGVLLGQLAGHMLVVPLTGFGAVFAFVFALIGFFVLDVADGVGRLWNSNVT
jgi:hypothetical protein